MVACYVDDESRRRAIEILTVSAVGTQYCHCHDANEIDVLIVDVEMKSIR